MKHLLLTSLAALLLSQVSDTSQAAFTPVQMDKLGAEYCLVFSESPSEQLQDSIISRSKNLLGDTLKAESKPIEIRGRSVGLEFFFSTPQSESLTLRLITPPMRAPRTIFTSYRTNSASDPELQLIYNDACQLQQVWQQTFNSDHLPTYSQQLSPHSFSPIGERQWLNAPVPSLVPLQPPRLRVGMIDSGVNYQLQPIANALARDSQGKLIGYDFWDMDHSPFDAHPTQSPFVIPRHGTRTASIVIDEAPGIAIVPYRYPRPDMSRMKQLVEHAAHHNVRIIGMPLGGNRPQEWAAFQKAAEAHPEILFIASAGNNGRDIDQRGVYPAALEIDNMLVVTSTDDFVKPAVRTNYGRISVDYLVPAERISALDFDGTHQLVSGSSYAVSRLVALAARLLNHSPSLSTEELKESIASLSIRANTGQYVSTGYIGDLFAATARVRSTALDVTKTARKPTRYQLPMDVFILSNNWQPAAINQAIEEANDIFVQCDIQIISNRWHRVEASEYLQHLSTGNALTLRSKLPDHTLAVYFVADTRMNPGFDAEAFGAGNTRNRPWLTNTLWITSDTGDLTIALAHELFHIITNDGNHSSDANNLMRDRTDKSNTVLTTQQCSAAWAYASKAGLLIEN